jgi:hypothetical protein
MKISFVPLEGDTRALVLQSRLAPEAKLVFYATGITVRKGLTRIDQKVGDPTWTRLIDVYQATSSIFGVGATMGWPNFHAFRSFSLRPIELGSNPLTYEISPGGLRFQSLAALSTSISGELSGVRVGPVSFTGGRDVLNIGGLAENMFGYGSGYKLGSTSSRGSGSGFINGATIDSRGRALQINPAFDPTLGTFQTWKPPATPPDKGWIATDGAFSVEGDLRVDPKTGWMALMPSGGGSNLYIPPDIANKAKIAGQVRGGNFDSADFDTQWRVTTSDQWIQALQTESGRQRVAAAIFELGNGDIETGVQLLPGVVTDSNTSALIRANLDYFRSLAEQNPHLTTP